MEILPSYNAYAVTPKKLSFVRARLKVKSVCDHTIAEPPEQVSMVPW